MVNFNKKKTDEKSILGNLEEGGGIWLIQPFLYFGVGIFILVLVKCII